MLHDQDSTAIFTYRVLQPIVYAEDLMRTGIDLEWGQNLREPPGQRTRTAGTSHADHTSTHQGQIIFYFEQDLFFSSFAWGIKVDSLDHLSFPSL